MRFRGILSLALLTAATATLACSGSKNNTANTGQANRNLADANAPAPTGENPTLAPGNAPTGPDPTQNVKPGPLTSTGGDNSSITNEMNPKTGAVTSTRVFKNNKNISKVVVVTGSQNGSLARTVTVYDIAGKPHQLPENQADSVMKENGDEIARSAGMRVIPSGTVVGDAPPNPAQVPVQAGKIPRTAADQAKEELNKVKTKIPQP